MWVSVKKSVLGRARAGKSGQIQAPKESNQVKGQNRQVNSADESPCLLLRDIVEREIWGEREVPCLI